MAEMATTRLINLYPNAGKVEETYVAAVMELLETYPLNDIRRFMDLRTGIVSRHKFLPSLAEIVDFIEGPAIHKHSDGTMRRYPERFNHGPNFTQQRLVREAERAKQGLPPEPEFKSRERIEHRGDGDPHWLTHPNPDAWWRKQRPPSQELAEDCKRHAEEVRQAMEAREALEKGR
jgi:hypothetical protein